MRTILVLLAGLALGMSAAPARAVDSIILDALGNLFDTADPGSLDGLRDRAADGDAKAQLLLYESYRTADRGGLGPRAFSDTVASRAEAEKALRDAADQGEPAAIFWLGVGLHRGDPMRRDPAEAQVWLERAIESGPPEARPYAEMYLGEILLFADDATDADRERGLALLDSALAAGAQPAVRAKARALREGIGTSADSVAARALLEEAVAGRNRAAYAPLGDMLVRGEGGDADESRGLGLLESPEARVDGLAGALLAKLYLEGEHIGPNPRKAIALMAPYAVEDFETRTRIAALLGDYRVNLPNADAIFFRLQEDEDSGEPGAAWTLLQLIGTLHEQFRDDELVFEIIERNKATDDHVALVNAEYLASWSTNSDYAETMGRMASETIDRLAAAGMAEAWTLKGQLLRKGWAYAQDDVAATEAFLRAAELGDPAGMMFLADAYEEGLGIPEDDVAYLRWVRQAAAAGSIDARHELTWAFHFDSSDRLMTLREGITEVLALWGDGIGGVTALEFQTLFSGPRLRDFEREEVIRAFMDGFRAAPAAVEEERLVTLSGHLPQDVKADIEGVLKADGFYDGAAEGYFRPDVRAALAAWTDAAGPLPPYEAPAEQVPLAGPAIPEIPLEVLNGALQHTFGLVESAQSDAEWQEVLPMIASLARFGDPSSRWALLRWYQQSDLVRAVVTPEELSRFGFDLLLLKHPEMDKLEIEFQFTMTMLYEANEGQAFADGLLTLIRDDARLSDEFTLEEILGQLVFLPGGCDMLLAGAAARGVQDLPEDECSNRETRDALLAWAEAAGPSGVEDQARAAAVPEVYAIAGATPP